ncbi:MAG: hypothetical protein CR959_01070 [Fusobacteriales bacterium]|nr:MAG: hypothetical protein CR959_01070 [Fusobacteriales bacterium]
MEEIIKKVNFYARLSKERDLSASEKEDRDIFRKLYLENFKKQVRGHLDNIEIVDKKEDVKIN